MNVFLLPLFCTADIQKLKKHNVEKILVNLLSAAQGDDVKTAICEAVQVMSPDLPSTDRFRDLGIRSTITPSHCNTHNHKNDMRRSEFICCRCNS